MSRKIDRCFSLKFIRDDKVYAKNEQVFEIYKVIPVNYLLIDDFDRKILMNKLQMALNSLSSPVQFLVINSNVDISDYKGILSINKNDIEYTKQIKQLLVVEKLIKQKFYLVANITNYSFSSNIPMFEKAKIRLHVLDNKAIIDLFNSIFYPNV